MKKIIKKTISGKLTRENDEKYAGGFWDLAGEISCKYNRYLPPDKQEELQEQIYYALWDVADEFMKSRIKELEALVEMVEKEKSLKYDKPRKKINPAVRGIIERQRQWADGYNQALADITKELKTIIKQLKTN